jgi:hypothetical protein
MNPHTDNLGISPKAARLIDAIFQNQKLTVEASAETISGVELKLAGMNKISAADENRLKLLHGEMTADDTSPQMRAQFARASLRARGLDLFAAPPGGK